MWTKELGRRLREARERKGWEVSDVAHRARLGRNTVYQLEKAERSDGEPYSPLRSTYAAAIRALGAEDLAEELGLDIDDTPSPSPTPNEIEELRTIIERRVDPAMAALRIAIEDAIREAVRTGRGT